MGWATCHIPCPLDPCLYRADLHPVQHFEDRTINVQVVADVLHTWLGVLLSKSQCPPVGLWLKVGFNMFLNVALPMCGGVGLRLSLIRSFKLFLNSVAIFIIPLSYLQPYHQAYLVQCSQISWLFLVVLIYRRWSADVKYADFIEQGDLTSAPLRCAYWH